MIESCPSCGATFGNDLELDQHNAMVHDPKWHGSITFSESGDEQATGAIGPQTTDTLLPRPSAPKRARTMQRGPGE